jgi:hypothetical protein
LRPLVVVARWTYSPDRHGRTGRLSGAKFIDSSKKTMTQFTHFYAGALMLAVISCGLLYMVAPHAAREIAKRAAISVLLFLAAGCVIKYSPGCSVLRIATVIAGVALAIASLVILILPETAYEILSATFVLGLTMVAIVAGVRWLWTDPTGRGALWIAGLVVALTISVRLIHT